jgi:hypothetical protein
VCITAKIDRTLSGSMVMLRCAAPRATPRCPSGGRAALAVLSVHVLHAQIVLVCILYVCLSIQGSLCMAVCAFCVFLHLLFVYLSVGECPGILSWTLFVAN